MQHRFAASVILCLVLVTDVCHSQEILKGVIFGVEKDDTDITFHPDMDVLTNEDPDGFVQCYVDGRDDTTIVWKSKGVEVSTEPSDDIYQEWRIIDGAKTCMIIVDQCASSSVSGTYICEVENVGSRPLEVVVDETHCLTTTTVATIAAGSTGKATTTGANNVITTTFTVTTSEAESTATATTTGAKNVITTTAKVTTSEAESTGTSTTTGKTESTTKGTHSSPVSSTATVITHMADTDHPSPVTFTGNQAHKTTLKPKTPTYTTLSTETKHSSTIIFHTRTTSLVTTVPEHTTSTKENTKPASTEADVVVTSTAMTTTSEAGTVKSKEALLLPTLLAVMISNFL